MNISLRKAIPSDIEWLDPFYESLMRPYVELTHEWDTELFRKTFSPETTEIIQLDGEDIGMLKIEERGDHLYLGDIQIKNEYQNWGIGEKLVKKLKNRAKNEERPIRLRVLKGNPAINFYERLGFEEYQQLNNSIELIYEV